VHGRADQKSDESTRDEEAGLSRLEIPWLQHVVNDVGRIEYVVAIEQSECPHSGTEPPVKSCYPRFRKFLMNIYDFGAHIALAVSG
jgi:hypothetical protein